MPHNMQKSLMSITVSVEALPAPLDGCPGAIPGKGFYHVWLTSAGRQRSCVVIVTFLKRVKKIVSRTMLFLCTRVTSQVYNVIDLRYTFSSWCFLKWNINYCCIRMLQLIECKNDCTTSNFLPFLVPVFPGTYFLPFGSPGQCPTVADCPQNRVINYYLQCLPLKTHLLAQVLWKTICYFLCVPLEPFPVAAQFQFFPSL